MENKVLEEDQEKRTLQEEFRRNQEVKGDNKPFDAKSSC